MYSAQIVKDRIDMRRNEKNISNLEKMLKELDIGKSTIYAMTDKKGIGCFALAKIADHLDCSVDYLLGRTDNPNITADTYIKGNNNGVQAISNGTNSTLTMQCYAYAHGKCRISHSITISKLNEMFLALLEDAEVTGDFKLELTENVKTKDVENLVGMIANEEKKLLRIRDAYENGVYTLQEFKESREKIMHRLDMLKKKQQSVSVHDEKANRQKVRKIIGSLLPSLRSPAISESDKSAMLRSVVKRVVFYRATGSIDVFFYA